MGVLNGQVALVTGGGHGTGRSQAGGLAREGAGAVGGGVGGVVVMWDVAAPVDQVPYPMATLDELEETVRLIEKEGRRGLGVVGDMRDTAQVQSVVDQTLAEFGRIDILVVNHGVISYGRLEDLTDDAWDSVV